MSASNARIVVVARAHRATTRAAAMTIRLRWRGVFVLMDAQPRVAAVGRSGCHDWSKQDHEMCGQQRQ